MLYAGQGKCAEAIAEADHEQAFDEAFAYATCGQSERTLKLVYEAEKEMAGGKLLSNLRSLDVCQLRPT